MRRERAILYRQHKRERDPGRTRLLSIRSNQSRRAAAQSEAISETAGHEANTRTRGKARAGGIQGSTQTRGKSQRCRCPEGGPVTAPPRRNTASRRTATKHSTWLPPLLGVRFLLLHLAMGPSDLAGQRSRRLRHSGRRRSRYGVGRSPFGQARVSATLRAQDGAQVRTAAHGEAWGIAWRGAQRGGCSA